MAVSCNCILEIFCAILYMINFFELYSYAQNTG